MEEEHSVEEEQRRPKGLQSFASPSFWSKLSSPRIHSQNSSFAKSTPKMFASPVPATQHSCSACKLPQQRAAMHVWVPAISQWPQVHTRALEVLFVLLLGFFLTLMMLESSALGNARSQVAWATPAWPPGMKA